MYERSNASVKVETRTNSRLISTFISCLYYIYVNLRALRYGAKNPSVEIHPKLRNFVEDDFDFFGYEQGRSSTTVVAGRL